MNDILGGAIRKATRPRGFCEWRPQAETRKLLDQVQQVLVEYDAYLPLTVRQIFYRLVGAHNYDKTEQAYSRLGEHLGRARRAELIPMHAIRDDGGQRIEPMHWRDVDEFLASMRRMASDFRLDRQADQPTRLVLVCEAAGMAPQLGAAVKDYGVPVISAGGFDSITDKHNLALDLSRFDSEVEVLHVGDHDPSGAHMFLALLEDVEAFALRYTSRVRFTRLAVTPAQIAEMSLPTAPPKEGDKRAFSGRTCQAEAIPPDRLNAIVTDAVWERFDVDIWQGVLDAERAARDELTEMLRH
jgi:hypothetical protein